MYIFTFYIKVQAHKTTLQQYGYKYPNDIKPYQPNGKMHIKNIRQLH